MRWDANRGSRRPTDPGAYWRRRFFILGGGLAVLAVLAWQFTSKGPSAATPAADSSSMAALRAAQTLPSAAYGSPAAAPSLTTPVEIPPTIPPPVTPSATQSSATASTSAGAAGPSCAPGDIVLTLVTTQASYGQTAQPEFHVYAVSTASRACQLPYGAGSVRVVVTRHGQVVWDSSACKAAVGKPVQFQLGVPQLLTVWWNRQAASPSGCAGSLSPGATGTFAAVAMTAGQSSEVRTFRLVS